MFDYESNPEAKGVEYQITEVDPTDSETKGKVYQVYKVTEEIAATMAGKIYRARIIKDPTEPTVIGKVYQVVFIDDPDDPSVKGKVYNAIVTGAGQAVVVGPGISLLALPDALSEDIISLIAFGGIEQTDAPTPDNPVPIVCNNGELKWDSVNETVYADGTQETINVHSKNLWNPDPTSYEYFDVTANGVKRYGHTYRNGTYTVKQNGTGGTAIIYLKIFSNGSYGTAQVITTAVTVTVSGDDVLLVYVSSGTATDTTDYDIQVERGADATDYQPYFDCGSAVAEMLLAIDDDIDQQEIIDGTVTRKIGWHIFDGKESFGSSSAYGTALYINGVATTWKAKKTKRVVCTHFLGRPTASNPQNLYTCFFNSSGHFYLRTTETAADFKVWLKDLYDAGTPMILFFVRSSTKTDAVTAQPMATQQGDNVAEITQASMDGLELEVTYNAGVTLTVEEVQDAQLSPDVEVTVQ